MKDDRTPANVKALRTAIGWSQTRLAREADVSRTQITELEMGRRRMSDAAVGRVARVLCVDADTLATQDFTPPKPWWVRLWLAAKWVWNGGMEQTW